jgi:anti-sigma regulatory factor (Ser/Thr protein kinase)
MGERQRTLVIRQFITEMVGTHPDDIAKLTAAKFRISRQAACTHVKWLADHGVLKSTGKTTARKYELQPVGQFHGTYSTKGLTEDVAWREWVAPLLKDAPENVVRICNIAFSELVNNVIDHSESDQIAVSVLCTPATVAIKIHDHGIGIFKKIKDACGLNDERDAILELGKGKLTTAPGHHSGMGIYFSSRMVDVFGMASGGLWFTHIQPDDDWLMELDREPIPGTYVDLVVSMFTERTPEMIYNKFCESPDSELGFSKTHVPIRLAQYGNEQLVSRSQAKRVLSRFERFSEVLLDFKGVEFVGQAFADEIFRVFATEHPRVKIMFSNADPQVANMIRVAQSLKRENQLTLFQT